MEGPIVPREIHTIYQGRIFTVQIETITLPKGVELKAEIVRHPGSVVIVPVTDSGDIILVRQYRHAIGRFAWELPAGSLKAGEDVDRAAVRECHEEIGLIPSRLERARLVLPDAGLLRRGDAFLQGVRPADARRVGRGRAPGRGRGHRGTAVPARDRARR